jgi:DNA-binding PadR family transcriptional regulator
MYTALRPEGTIMARRTRSPRELLTPAALHMLMALAREDLHGYGIKQKVEARSGGRLRLGPGTLYEGIHRMEAAGWIRETDASDDPSGKRKFYRLTVTGRRVMEEELERLAEVVRFARTEELLPEEAS